MIHAYLADSVKINILEIIHRGQNLRCLPTRGLEYAVEGEFIFPCVLRFASGQQLLDENEEEQSAITSQGESRDLAAWGGVADINQLIARPITFDFKSGDSIAKLYFELVLGSECQSAYIGMQPVGADQQIELARGGSCKTKSDVRIMLLDGRDFIVKDGFNSIIERGK